MRAVPRQDARAAVRQPTAPMPRRFPKPLPARCRGPGDRLPKECALSEISFQIRRFSIIFGLQTQVSTHSNPNRKARPSSVPFAIHFMPAKHSNALQPSPASSSTARRFPSAPGSSRNIKTPMPDAVSVMARLRGPAQISPADSHSRQW